MTAPEPTEHDRRNAENRRQIADRQLAEWTQALKLALGTLGPGWQPWMKISLIDSDHRRSGNTEPVAVVWKVYTGPQRLTENSLYLRKMPDGTVKKAKNYDELLDDMLHEPHPTRTLEFKGQVVPAPRWTLCWQALETYTPKTAEQLSALRVSRERGKAERATAKERAENPLFTVWAERLQAEEEEQKER